MKVYGNEEEYLLTVLTSAVEGRDWLTSRLGHLTIVGRDAGTH
jgi:hypothetical protein